MRAILLITTACCAAAACGPRKSSDVTSDQLPSIPAPNVEVEPTGNPDPIASPNAVYGGEITTWGGGFPKSFNVWLDANAGSGRIMSLLFEGLVGLHPTENRPEGQLADSWEISPDGMTFVFHIHPKAAWSDGKPVTAADVQFFYDTMMDPKNPTSVFRVGLSRLKRPEVIDEKTLKVVANERHWSVFWDAGGLNAFPKHVWEGKTFTDINFEFPVVSGPYKIKELLMQRALVLERRPDWWGRVKKINQHTFNFDYIRLRFMDDRSKALEALKKGDFDLYPLYTAALWAQQTHFPAVEKGWVVRQELFNSDPKGFQGFAMNMRRQIFQDVRVRKALSHLLNREMLLDKIMFNQYFLLNSYFPDLYPGNHNPDAPFFQFDPNKARALLDEAGWKVNARGILEKDGKEFQIVFLYHGEPLPHLNIYMQDLLKVGIEGRVEFVDQATHAKRIDEHAFDMVWTAWGAGRLRDPENQWHSKTANEIATYNLPGYSNPAVDALIERQKTELDIEKRNVILREIDAILTADVPYVLLWQSDRTKLLYWNRFGTPPAVIGKFGNEDAAISYWWLDTLKSRALDDARRANAALPLLPTRIDVDL